MGTEAGSQGCPGAAPVGSIVRGPSDPVMGALAVAQLFPWARAGLMRHGRLDVDELEGLRRRMGLALTGRDDPDWPEIDRSLGDAVGASGTGLAALVRDPGRDLPALYLFTLASAVELDHGTATLLARVQPATAAGWLRVGSADALLADLFPDAPALDIGACALARHRLLLFDGAGPAVQQQVYTSGDHWQALAAGCLPPEFEAIVPAEDRSADANGPAPPDGYAPDGTGLDDAAAALRRGLGVAVQADGHEARRITAALAARLRRRPVAIAHEDWRQRSLRALTAFAAWLPLVDCREHDGAPLAAAEIDHQAVLLLRGDQQLPEHYRRLEVPEAGGARRRGWWRRHVADEALVGTLASARLGRGAVDRIAEQLFGDDAPAPPDRSRGDLLRRVRQVRTADASAHLRRVAQPVETHCDDAMLVLTEETAAALERCHRRCLRRDYGELGMGESIRATADSGVVLLFSGASGTGKTLASAWLATRLGAPLYRIDLAMVMNKYVGETEKNLSLALDEAARGDVMLLFDEADALFGKRSDGGHGGDRFANMLTNFLLTRIESHPGIVVLTTNAGNRMDSAFVRRIDIGVEFESLDPGERTILWQRLLAGRDPGGDLCRRIARHCDLAPGHVRNVVVNACCWYPDQVPLSPAALWQALEAEYRKASRAMPSQLMALREAPEPGGSGAR